MKKYLFIALFFCLCLSLSAQNYTRNFGFRAGLTSGLTYRQFYKDNLAYEVWLNSNKKGLQLTILKQTSEPTLLQYSDNLYFTCGYGGHIGFSYQQKYDFLFFELTYESKKFAPLIGMDGYLGIEYRMPELPFVLGFDYKPFFEFSTRRFFYMSIWDIAFTFKYAF